ncbi:hypothetical protein GCM10010961_35020 [Pseudodonghicola xiamenensis]|uniref:Uncharacterized protein n=1 Tax=Pseudodonghicola xiamenensis TaxID=337702 RepID=A0A8J3MEN9_9RHOB|nr:hypothetical protein GCM10010961_35020 [Pseudodonghicola xiamenensis]
MQRVEAKANLSIPVPNRTAQLTLSADNPVAQELSARSSSLKASMTRPQRSDKKYGNFGPRPRKGQGDQAAFPVSLANPTLSQEDQVMAEANPRGAASIIILIKVRA